ncbi:hypothetical protein BP5796_07738 [Coleophoma crateriformis]|uniref:Carrier domain-containing protein n=1 Tax=Coleophoma crateriformis TaxID=565419 RepID=A0A3D8RCV5_9HELO|nr:hypothetical protein BP5796_07738 [Coleophoma crateriformis]
MAAAAVAQGFNGSIQHVSKSPLAQHIEHSVDSKKDESIYTITDLLVQRARHSPNVSLLAYPGSSKGTDDYVHHTARDLDRFADEAARKYMSMGIPAKENGNTEVLAILAPTSLDYVTSIFALSRLGYTLLLLSNRLPNEALLSLISKTNCHRIVCSANFNQTIAALQEKSEILPYTILDRSSYDLPVPTGPRFHPNFDGPTVTSQMAFIIHSSGSTGLPKPIFQTHKAALTNYSSGLPYKAFLTLPLYHNHGLSTFFRAIFAGNEIAIFNANLPLTGPNLIAAMAKLRPGGFHGVPYALKLLGESEQGISLLRDCQVVMFGGSSCPDELGDKLVDAGVYLVSHYGATEIGQVLTSFRPRETDKAWNYLRSFPGKEQYLKFERRSPDSFELIALDGLPTKVVSNSDNPPNSFHTSDLFRPHPTIPNAWKYLGRSDDRITLLNGEKVLPIPFEHQVRSNEFVQECWMFGVGRALPGLMIIASENARDMSKEEILERVWPSITEANSQAEGFGQVSKEMVEILPVGTEYPCTDKGTMIRAKVYKKFESEFESLYKRFEDGSHDGTTVRKILSMKELQDYLLDGFVSKFGFKDLEIDTDLFAAGVDSLQAITIWGLIRRELDLGAGTVGQNVVFEHPSIRALAAHLYSLRTGESVVVKDEITLMSELIEKYSDFTPHVPGDSAIEKECVIVTGATGSLGAHILSQLAAKENIGTIYCLVRASTPAEATRRVLSTLSSRLLPSVAHQRLVCLPADMSKADLGLGEEIINQLKSSLTKVFHCAWAVNFNLGVSSFESHHIRGTYNLISLCLSTTTAKPASLYFCSSISAAAGTPLPARIPETYLTSLKYAQNMGYARSKLVTENIIKAAVEKTGMCAKVLRSGQIVGDTQEGVWNSTEAIPLMLRSAVTLGALPELDEQPSWLPTDLVAKAFLDISGLNGSEASSKPQSTSVVYHIENTQKFHWTSDLLPALQQSGLTFRAVSQREWVQLLRDSNPDPVANPTIKLLDFFSEKYDRDGPGRSELVFETELTGEASPTVRDGYDVIGSGLISRMVMRWACEWGNQV